MAGTVGTSGHIDAPTQTKVAALMELTVGGLGGEIKTKIVS